MTTLIVAILAYALAAYRRRCNYLRGRMDERARISGEQEYITMQFARISEEWGLIHARQKRLADAERDRSLARLN